MKLLIGLDWSQDHHHVCILAANGSQQASFEIPHTVEGFARLDAERAKFGVAAKECLVALDANRQHIVGGFEAQFRRSQPTAHRRHFDNQAEVSVFPSVRYAEAVEAYQQAVALDPEDVAARQGLEAARSRAQWHGSKMQRRPEVVASLSYQFVEVYVCTDL